MRKNTTIILHDDGRELHFKITQMTARQQERWLNRVVMLLAGSKGLESALDGLQSKLKEGKYEELLCVIGAIKYEDIEPLYDELLECCAHIPDPTNSNFATQLTVSNVDSIVGEVKTLYRLRMEALKLNFSFFSNGEKSPSQRKADITITKRM